MKHAAVFFTLTAAALAQTAPPKPSISPVTSAMLAKPDPADWLMWRRMLDGLAYSPLTQISRGNVANLKLVW